MEPEEEGVELEEDWDWWVVVWAELASLDVKVEELDWVLEEELGAVLDEELEELEEDPWPRTFPPPFK